MRSSWTLVSTSVNAPTPHPVPWTWAGGLGRTLTGRCEPCGTRGRSSRRGREPRLRFRVHDGRRRRSRRGLGRMGPARRGPNDSIPFSGGRRRPISYQVASQSIAREGMILEPGQRVLGGRFRCTRRIKAQHGVETWLAVDLEAADGARGRHVVVKRAAAADLADGVAARRETEAEVQHRLAPLVRAPVSFAREGDDVYLVQPLIEGVTLQERLVSGPLSVASTLAVAIDVLSVLQHAHDHGVLHRDVKPANVIVNQAAPIDQAVLIDFGFARSSSLAPQLRDEHVGTVRYMAPEVAGLLPGPVDGRSDLYSAGILLFTCLAGSPPFAGSDVGAVLQQHLSAAAPRLRALGVDVPQALDAVVQRLLRK